MSKGLILILHNGITKVNAADCIAALPDAWKALDREKIEVTYSEVLELSKLYDLNFGQYALEHRRQFENEIYPLLQKKSDYRIAYFGLAPIPLAMDLGQLFHNFRDIEIFELHHEKKEWYQKDKDVKAAKNPITVIGLPDKNQKGIISALIRVSGSHFVNPEETNVIVPNAAEVDIQFERPDDDALHSPELQNEFAEHVKDALDVLSDNRSGLREIHFFGAIPTGQAFLIGTKISPNIHPYIQTYQYSRLQDPKYRKALTIKGTIEPQRVISKKQRSLAGKLRTIGNQELVTNIRKYCIGNEKTSKKRTWYVAAMPELQGDSMNVDFWNELPPICDTSLKADSFDLDAQSVVDGFMWRNNNWHVDDSFFISLNDRITKEDEVRKAIRLFLFHESLHYKKHGIDESTAPNIGSFPKVLEIADYQADVYGIVNEYAYHSSMIGEVKNVKEFFLNAIRIATETMWSFDDQGHPLKEIQIRRLSRYMIWYWQYARIEKEGNSITDIIKILEEKPVIELNGLGQ